MTARAVRIGLTGPIGCGKSTVGRWITELGGALVDADEVARDVTAAGTPAADAIARRFGPRVRAADAGLDRAELARVVFADPDALRALEAIVHPAVRPIILARIEAAEAAGADVVAIEAIRLVESGLADVCDEVWLVTCSPDEQRTRLAGRGMSRDDAERRISAQAGMTERLRPAATRVVTTSGTSDDTRRSILVALSAAREARSAGAASETGTSGPG